MKLKKILLTAICAIAALTGTLFSACAKPLPSHVQPLNYAETTEKINNPDQGFYRPIFVKVNEDGVEYDKNIVNAGTQLYHLRIDISAFSAAANGKRNKSLTGAALSGLKELLSYLKQNDKNAVVRFAYDPYYGGSKDKEPPIGTVLKHIKQACNVIENFPSTVTAIEAGMIGPWGEMHSSVMANSENITRIVQKFLDETRKIPILVRTPRMIYDYLGITIKDIADYSVDTGAKAYRLGLFNDGYLGSHSDLGTYTDRAAETEFLSRQTDHLPYGGEVTIPDSKLHDIEVCLPEMHKLNLSYLNIEWNNQVIDKWQNTYYTQACGTDEAYFGKPAFKYIENRMGYRFVLTRSDLKYGDNLNKMEVELSLKNVGFGNLNRVKRTKLIICNESGEEVFSTGAPDFSGQESLSFTVKPRLASGKYSVYLRIYGDEAEGTPLYCLRFANDNLWSDTLKANKIGEISL